MVQTVRYLAAARNDSGDVGAVPVGILPVVNLRSTRFGIAGSDNVHRRDHPSGQIAVRENTRVQHGDGDAGTREL